MLICLVFIAICSTWHVSRLNIYSNAIMKYQNMLIRIKLCNWQWIQSLCLLWIKTLPNIQDVQKPWVGLRKQWVVTLKKTKKTYICWVDDKMVKTILKWVNRSTQAILFDFFLAWLFLIENILCSVCAGLELIETLARFSTCCEAVCLTIDPVWLPFLSYQPHLTPSPVPRLWQSKFI